MKFDFTDNTVEWDQVVIPMRDIEVQVEGEDAFYQHKPNAVIEATARIKNILDAKYEKLI